jgi:hypothetical protein
MMTKEYNSVEKFSVFIVCKSENEAEKLAKLHRKICVVKREEAKILQAGNVSETEVATLLVSPAYPSRAFRGFFWQHEILGGVKFIKCSEDAIFDFKRATVGDIESFQPPIKKLNKVAFNIPECPSVSAAVDVNTNLASVLAIESQRLVTGSGVNMSVLVTNELAVVKPSISNEDDERLTKKRIVVLPLQSSKSFLVELFTHHSHELFNENWVEFMIENFVVFNLLIFKNASK